HRLGRGRKEMSAIGEPGLSTATQAQPGFVNESGRLQCLAGRFACHPGRGEFAQFIINQRQQFFGSIGITWWNRLEDLRYLAHCRENRKRRGLNKEEIGRLFGKTAKRKSAP